LENAVTFLCFLLLAFYHFQFLKLNICLDIYIYSSSGGKRQLCLVRNASADSHACSLTRLFFWSVYASVIFILRHWLCHFDSTFFKDFHRDLARIVKHLLSKAGSSEAIFLSPKRGNSLDLFLEVAKENGLRFSVTENYDQEVWKRHEGFLSEDRDSWPSYEKGHSYPLLIRITLWAFFLLRILLGPLSVVGWLLDNVQTNSETGIVLIQTLTGLHAFIA